MHPVHGCGEEYISAKTLRLFEDSVVSNDGIEIGIVGNIGAAAVVGLTDSACSVNEHFIETALMWLEGFFVTEVPLAEDATGIAGGFEDLGQSCGVERESFAFEDGVSDAVSHGMATGHQGRASGAACG